MAATTLRGAALVRLQYSGRRVYAALAGIAALLGAGCGAAMRHLPELATAETPQVEGFDDHGWALTLLENVSQGCVNYDHLRAHPEPLLAFLAQIERIGPRTHPEAFATRASVLTYYVNAYNACALRAVLDAGVPESMYELGRASPELRFSFVVEGRRVTLADLRRAAREAAGTDARIEFCLCEPAIGAAPLPSTPLRPDGLDAQLDAIARTALARDAVLRFDHARERILVALFVHHRREALIDGYRRRMGTSHGTLVNVLNLLTDEAVRARLASAVGYEIVPMPFDRRLNACVPEPAPSPAVDRN
ncbi:MAG: DUF547 domain-containing protein [Phycisphaerae bacterium]|nr:MAG: DUF547 domain-containing protein [Planctomycetota bacterium]KAB2950040.1 MAG: DUF547 domain-containing protein [Phycisphaerae bacterium]MBE7458311.1 DUF547 domain-containing protein [Planctomycetia bacterium]MCK6465804.1 DUF547 domain-containing protein [Phycisphaerae bacterium]MCL4719316.1 DUF547 domain-containing protein [Phycisphaerae bacterium]